MHGVVEGLPGEGDAVLGRGEFFHEGTHGGVSLEFRVVLGDNHELTKGATQARLSLCKVAHGGRVGRVARKANVGLRGLRTGFDDRGQRAAFMGHVTLGGFDEVRDEVVTALQLHVHLGEGVLEAVPQPDEGVVDADQEEADENEGGEKNKKCDDGETHSAVNLPPPPPTASPTA